MAAFKIRKLKIFLKINLDQTAGLHDNNLDCKGLISSKNLFERPCQIDTIIQEQKPYL